MGGSAEVNESSASQDKGPSGFLWRVTGPITRRSRHARFAVFMDTMRPSATDRVLDVGVHEAAYRSSNFFEVQYPWPAQITAVGLVDQPFFRAQFPEVSFVIADGRALPFEDQTFDIGFANAVIEHTGTREQQRLFVSEMVRTCRRVFISTPNAHFPVDPHTLLPFVHWLPRPIRHRLLHWTGKGGWASVESLNPVSSRTLLSFFPRGAEVRLIRQRLLGITSVITAATTAPVRREDESSVELT